MQVVMLLWMQFLSRSSQNDTIPSYATGQLRSLNYPTYDKDAML